MAHLEVSFLIIQTNIETNNKQQQIDKKHSNTETTWNKLIEGGLGDIEQDSYVISTSCMPYQMDTNLYL